MEKGGSRFYMVGKGGTSSEDERWRVKDGWMERKGGENNCDCLYLNPSKIN